MEDTGLAAVLRSLPKALKQRIHVEITRLASRLSKFAIAGHLSDDATTKFPKGPSGVCILV
jgi:hypothetical protein